MLQLRIVNMKNSCKPIKHTTAQSCKKYLTASFSEMGQHWVLTGGAPNVEETGQDTEQETGTERAPYCMSQ